MAIISSFKQLIDPISSCADFKKIIFRRAPDGRAFLFVKFAKQNHMKAAYSAIHNKWMGGQQISVQLTTDDDLPKATKALSIQRGSTLYRAGFIIQHLRNGHERLTTIIPTRHVDPIDDRRRDEDPPPPKPYVTPHPSRHRRHRMGKKLPFAMHREVHVQDMMMDEDHPREGEPHKSKSVKQNPITTERKIKCNDAPSLIEPTEPHGHAAANDILNIKQDKNTHIRCTEPAPPLLEPLDTTQAPAKPKCTKPPTCTPHAVLQHKSATEKRHTVKEEEDRDTDIEILDLKRIKSRSKAQIKSDIIGENALKTRRTTAECKEKEENDCDANIVCNSPIAAHFNANPVMDTTTDYSMNTVDYSAHKKSKNVTFNTNMTCNASPKRPNDVIMTDAVPKPVAPPPKKSKTKLKCRLFIENINPSIGDNQLKTKFEKFGSVSSAKIIRDPATNASKGVGFVTFKSSKASKRAISAMNNASWYGQKLCVSYVSDKSVANTNHASIKKRAVIPRDPRARTVVRQPQTQTQTPIPPPRPPPPPSPPHAPVAVIKPPIVHNFSPNQVMQTVAKAPASDKAPSLPVPTPTKQSKQVHFSASHHTQSVKTCTSKNGAKTQTRSQPTATSYISNQNNNASATTQTKSRYLAPSIQPMHTTTAAAQYYPYNRFMPLVIHGNHNAIAIQQPPIISGSLSQIKQQNLSSYLTQMHQTQLNANSVSMNGGADAAGDINWNHGLLLGKLPANLPKEYHKLRFHIEQSVGVPVTAIHVLEKPIAASSNAGDIFTCCTLFDSEIETKDAFEKLQSCTIMNQSIICDMASNYIPQINAILGAKQTSTAKPQTDTSSTNTESNIKLKSMSISRTPSPNPPTRTFSPPSTNSKSATPSKSHSRESEPSSVDRAGKERDDSSESHRRRRNRGGRRGRRRLTDDEFEYHPYRRRRSRSRDRHRSRDRYYHSRYRDRHQGRSRDRRYHRDRYRRRHSPAVKFSGFSKRDAEDTQPPRRRRFRRSRSRSWSPSSSRSRTRSRSRSRSYRKDNGKESGKESNGSHDAVSSSNTKSNGTDMEHVKSRCVVLSCSGGHAVRDLKETEITNFVDGSIIRIMKRVIPLHKVSDTPQCQLYFYIKFESVSSAKQCFEKLKVCSHFHCYSLTAQPMDEKTWDSYFPALDPE